MISVAEVVGGCVENAGGGSYDGGSRVDASGCGFLHYEASAGECERIQLCD